MPVRARLGPDLAGKHGAEQLAAKIERYWHERGHDNVRAWVEAKPIIMPQDAPVYSVRTNLIKGMPPPIEE